MSKDKLPKGMIPSNDILSEVARGRTSEAPQKEHNSNTESIQKVHKDNTLEIHHIRIHKNDWAVLQHYFEGKGIKVSQGIRMILKEYLEQRGIQ